MKNKIIISICLFAGFFTTSCENNFDTPPIASVDPEMILTIADIYKIQADSGNNYVFENDFMLFASISMSDKSGNIYKEAYIQDSTGGINLYKLSNDGLFEVGDYVRINLNGAKIVDYSGKMELVFEDVLDFEKSMMIQDVKYFIEPALITLDELETGAYDCKLVKIDSLQFKSNELGKTFYISTNNAPLDQNRYLEDKNKKSVIVRTSGYADFANDTIPSGSGSIIAIATKYVKQSGTTDWQLIIRSADEIIMNGNRFE